METINKRQTTSPSIPPRIGAGTFKITTKEQIISALRIGYMHLDLAESYDNLHVVHDALLMAFKPASDGGLGIERSSLYLTLKVFSIWGDEQIPRLLEKVGTEYFDLLLYHTPLSLFKDQSTMETNWKRLIKEKTMGRVLNIGVSNFYLQHLSRLLQYCVCQNIDKPYANEIQINPYVIPEDVIDFCKEWNILIIAYSPLGFHKSTELLNERNLNQIANELNGTPAQVVLAWLKLQDYYIIPKSCNDDHLRENYDLDAIAFKLKESPHAPHFNEMIQSLQKPQIDLYCYMIDISLDAFLQIINWEYDSRQISLSNSGEEDTAEDA